MLCVTIGSMMEKRWDDSPRSEGTGRPNVLEDEQVWKISQAEQKSWNSGEKIRVEDLWKKGKTTQEDCKDVMMLCREKIRRDTAQLELNLTTAIKTIKNIFINTLARK